METCGDYLLWKPIAVMCFWSNYCNENTHHIERIPVGVKNIDHLFQMASEIIKADNLHLILLSDGTRLIIMNTYVAWKTVQN